jgi:hypothetical protein
LSIKSKNIERAETLIIQNFERKDKMNQNEKDVFQDIYEQLDLCTTLMRLANEYVRQNNPQLYSVIRQAISHNDLKKRRAEKFID